MIFLLRKFGDNVLPTLSSVLVSGSRGSSSCESGEYIFLGGEEAGEEAGEKPQLQLLTAQLSLALAVI